MPDLNDKIFCSEQIHIPPTFPFIMKLYCKAAIRTQPYDLLKWSAAYFRALANGEEPPVKERVEFPPYDSPSGVTPGYIKVLINQFGKDPETVIPAQTLFKKWTDICLDEHLLVKLIALVGPTTQINWVKFVGVCAGFISKTLTHTMILVCELFTEEPEGGMATIPYALFVDLYMYLAQMECGPLAPEELKEQEEEDQAKEVCDAVDKIRKGLYEDEDELMGEGEELAYEKDEGKSEKSRRTSARTEIEGEVEEEEERSREESDVRSSKSRRKRTGSVKSTLSQKVMSELIGEAEGRESYSESTFSVKSSVKMSPSSGTVVSEDRDDAEKSEKKKSKETEGEADTDQEGKSIMEVKMGYDGRRRTTFGGVSIQKDSVDNEREYDASSGPRRKTGSDQYGSGPREGRSTVVTPPSSRGRSTVGGSLGSPISGPVKSSLEKLTSQEKVYPRPTTVTLKSDDTHGRNSSIDKKSFYGKFIAEGLGASTTKKHGKIDLDQFEDSIRVKIEAKLAEEDELMDEEEKELKDLNTYLTSVSAQGAQKISIDPLGYKIFRKFMRQDVPGIGPFVETSQVEKVVDYMDYWSHKQNGMVMPRNIRHWMCPPLDKLPPPEP